MRSAMLFAGPKGARGGEEKAQSEGSLTISGHPNGSYNGLYSKQKELINDCPWYQKTAPDGSVRVLFYYNQNSGGVKSWSLIARLWDGRSDFSEGGWIGPDTYPKPPLPHGTKEWTCGTLTLDFKGHGERSRLQ